MSVECFVTGGTGFIGQHLVAHLSAKGHTVRVLMRRPERLTELREQVVKLGGSAARVFAVAGDLERDNLGLSPADREQLRQARVVFHLGAHFAWGLSLEQSRAVNVEGAKRVALLAVEQNSRLVMIGGYMLKNHEHLQRIGIDPRSAQQTHWPAVYRRVGGYEASKLEAHFATLELMSAKGGEITVVHPATVCGHSRTGHILDGQPLVELIRNLIQGKLTAVPGTAKHWLPLVTVDYLVELMVVSAFDPAMVGQELLALDEQTPNLQELLVQVAQPLGLKPPRHHISLRLLKLLLSIPPVARFMNTKPEALDFIQTTRFDMAAVEQFAKSHGIAKPDIRQSLQHTATFVNSSCIAKG
ncbi:NAD-dependent dehydratase [Pseudomonas protegens]|uniref:SDR family oxidoreductase n=1 Tax=Pseudomonas chlororaphis group TaxID=136842 RepID=UPI000C99FC9E|nr:MULTISPECIES: SDR family oxidoreductase [Pseudomonas chlororaphis group]MCO7577564.1 SDR family oxidoreductase [Pseudomonas protegens]MCO7583720.1 SDR family oxidoreductase [Pseudomonas chlororaphis]MCO7600947.1 SDR family oxidoreductase [Pseudomonas chlororaphis]MDP9531237.1 SDR family oxidoreductase [Pseudomonas protegens]PNG38026.1 NAD-dependent dehydratase [Pseudomonas protegens]